MNRVLYPNIGGEEEGSFSLPAPGVPPESNLAPLAQVGVRAVASLWPLLFEGAVTLDDSFGIQIRPLALALVPGDWKTSCEDGGAFTPWLSTPAAAARAQTLGRRYDAPPPEIVAGVHDKAFAAHASPGVASWSSERAHRPEDCQLQNLVTVLSPEDLLGANAAKRIESLVHAWPDAYQTSFTLKPRWGSSGRGRVAGTGGRLPESSARALPRLAARGGALLEPWFDRVEDLSVQLFIRSADDIEILGSTRQIVERSGLYRGNAGVFGAHRSLASGSAYDEAARSAAAQVARVAAQRGFHGYCGVDSFVYRDPEGAVRFRPVVEFNARVTVGTIALAAVRAAYRSPDAPTIVSPHEELREESRGAMREGTGEGLRDESRDAACDVSRAPLLDWLFLLKSPSPSPAAASTPSGRRNCAEPDAPTLRAPVYDPFLGPAMIVELLEGESGGPVVLLRIP